MTSVDHLRRIYEKKGSLTKEDFSRANGLHVCEIVDAWCDGFGYDLENDKPHPNPLYFYSRFGKEYYDKTYKPGIDYERERTPNTD